MLRNKARKKPCINLISGITFANQTPAERAEYHAYVVAIDAALVAGLIHVPFEDDEKT